MSARAAFRTLPSPAFSSASATAGRSWPHRAGAPAHSKKTVGFSGNAACGAWAAPAPLGPAPPAARAVVETAAGAATAPAPTAGAPAAEPFADALAAGRAAGAAAPGAMAEGGRFAAEETG